MKTYTILVSRKSEKKSIYICIHTQSTKVSSMVMLLSTGRFPVISSNNMTPNENTSDFSVNFPLDAYSGARYLQMNVQRKQIDQSTNVMFLEWRKGSYQVKNAYPKVPITRVDT